MIVVRRPDRDWDEEAAGSGARPEHEWDEEATLSGTNKAHLSPPRSGPRSGMAKKSLTDSLAGSSLDADFLKGQAPS